MQNGTRLSSELDDLSCRRCLPVRRVFTRMLPGLLTIIFSVSSLFSAVGRADQLEELAKKAGIEILRPGDSAAGTQKASATSMPLNRLTPEQRKRATEVIQNCNQFRRLPSLRYTIDEPIYRYLLEHPDVAVSTWRVMGISQFEMWQTGPLEYEAAAVDGSEGLADILYRDAGQTLFICEGSYHHVLLPRPLQAAALIWFRAEYTPHESGTHIVTQHADVFVHFPSAGVAGLAKVLTPVTNGLMDRNIFEVSLYASLMSRGVRDEPEWIVDLAEDMEGVLPQRKGELIAVARQPRQTERPPSSRAVSGASLDRRLLQSPELLFMDPPRPGSTMRVDPQTGMPVITVSDGTGAPVPVTGAQSTRTVSDRSADATREPRKLPRLRSGSGRDQVSEDLKSSAENLPPVEPAVPPTGPTATGPVGRGTSSLPLLNP